MGGCDPQCFRHSGCLSTSLHLNPPEALWNAEGGEIMTAYEAVMLVLALVSIGIGIVSIMKK